MSADNSIPRDKGKLYGKRRGEAGAVGGVSAMVRNKPSDLSTPALERMA